MRGLPRSDRGRLSPDEARRIAEECYDEVLAYCRRHAPAGHDPADLAQETFLRFVRAEGYRDHGRPIAYLMRIARSACVDASRRRRVEVVSLDFDVADERAEGVPGKPAEDASTDEISCALATLPADLREVVELRYGSDLGVGEVAGVLGISRFAVRRRIRTALDLLARELGEGDTHGRT